MLEHALEHIITEDTLITTPSLLIEAACHKRHGKQKNLLLCMHHV